MYYTIEKIRNDLPPLEVHTANKTPMMSPKRLAALKLDLLSAGNNYNTIYLMSTERSDRH